MNKLRFALAMRMIFNDMRRIALWTVSWNVDIVDKTKYLRTVEFAESVNRKAIKLTFNPL